MADLAIALQSMPSPYAEDGGNLLHAGLESEVLGMGWLVCVVSGMDWAALPGINDAWTE